MTNGVYLVGTVIKEGVTPPLDYHAPLFNSIEKGWNKGVKTCDLQFLISLSGESGGNLRSSRDE
jgi:hypothetical protein